MFYDTNKNVKKLTVRSSDDGITFSDLLVIDYFWSELKVGTYVLVPTAFKAVFANPMIAGDQIKCTGMTEGSTYAANLFDLNGKLLSTINFKGDFQLPSVATAGMYLLTNHRKQGAHTSIQTRNSLKNKGGQNFDPLCFIILSA